MSLISHYIDVPIAGMSGGGAGVAAATAAIIQSKDEYHYHHSISEVKSSNLSILDSVTAEPDVYIHT